jgi:hypothetical protein
MRRLCFVLSIIVLTMGTMRIAHATLIDFDDVQGYPCGCLPGTVIPPAFVVNDEYIDRGVLFDSAGGGIFIAASTGGVSPPNSMGGLGVGSVIDYFAPINISFWDRDGEAASVDFVSLTLTSSSDHAVMRAYDVDGVLLGSVLGTASETMTVDFPGLISSIVVLPNYAAFDDLAFSNMSIPIPGAIWLFGCALSGLSWSLRRRR